MSPDETVAEPRLAHFPITFYATVMGLAGMSLAARAAEAAWGLPGVVSSLLLAATVAAFVTITALLGVKWQRHRAQFLAEWDHPVKKAFFPAMSISLLLIATASAHAMPNPARVVWLVGAALQAVLTVAVISGWIGHRPYQPMHISPAWFIPAVGNVVAPVAGAHLGFTELSWLFFSAGMIFWLVLLVLVMNRLIFHDPLPGRLLPTMTILIAPPAVGFLAWLALNGGTVDAFARVLLNAAYVFAVLVAVKAPEFRSIPFALSWWALSFPLAALTIATLRFAEATGSATHAVLASVLLPGLACLIAALIWRTAIAIRRGEVCQPE